MKEFVAGDIVRIKDISHYIVSFAKKAADRDAVVVWCGPIRGDQFKDMAKVRFLKRNGRGKEFEEILQKRDLILKSDTLPASDAA